MKNHITKINTFKLKKTRYANKIIQNINRRELFYFEVSTRIPHWRFDKTIIFWFYFSKLFYFFLLFTRKRTENCNGNGNGNGGRYTLYGDLWFTSRLCRSLRLTPPERGIVSRFCAPVRDLRTLKTTLTYSTVVTPQT